MITTGFFNLAEPAGVIQLLAAVFILPFILFSLVAGRVIDASANKRYYLLANKAAELLIMLLATVGILSANLTVLMLCLFATGIQSAFFGPIKYSILPKLLSPPALLGGNAVISASTLGAILMGVFAGTYLGADVAHHPVLCAGLVGLSVVGLVAAYFVPLKTETVPPAPATESSFSTFTEVLSTVHRNRPLLNLVICGSLFWAISTVLLGELPALGIRGYSYALVFVFGGAVAGAGLLYFLLRGKNSTKYSLQTLLVALLISVFINILFANSDSFNWFVVLLLCVFVFSAAIVFFIIPVIVSIQSLNRYEHLGRIIATYNLYNALAIVTASLIASLIHFALPDGVGVHAVFVFIACLLFIALLFSCLIIPRETLQVGVQKVCRWLFGVEVRGAENLNIDKPHLIIANHQSVLDGPLISAFLENRLFRLVFAVNYSFDNYPLSESIGSRLAFIHKLDSFHPNLRSLIKLIKDKNNEQQNSEQVSEQTNEQGSGHVLSPFIFPEGRITTTGNQMQIYSGATVLLERVCANRLIPVAIEGLQHSRFSYLKGQRPLRWFPKVIISIGKPQTLTPPPTITDGKSKRHWFAQKMADALEAQRISSITCPPNLTQLFADSLKKYGPKSPLFCDVVPERQLSFRQTYLGGVILGKIIDQQKKRVSPDQSNVGFLLPSSAGGAVAFYGTVFYGHVPVMLNITAGASQVLSACQTAQIKMVCTARALLERLPDTQDIVDKLQENNIHVFFLEDARAQITLADKLKALLTAANTLPGYHADSQSLGCVLFTSGSEGTPKGVALSHHNLIYNATQTLSRISTTTQDIMLNALPIFHTFGLMGGVILPVAGGIKVHQYPSPLHYRNVPEIIYMHNITIFFSTNTFLKNYAKHMHPYSAISLKHVFAGAEKLEQSTYDEWLYQFGVRIMQGYGTTETSPVIAVNTALFNKLGSVGKPLAGIHTQLKAVEGIAHGKALWVQGDNVMLGYILPTNPGVIQPVPNNWYDTGDIVNIDEDGYIFIVGRGKRFIKVAGEMVPLDAIETLLQTAYPDSAFAVVGVPHPTRGEQPALMSTVDINRQTIGQLLSDKGLSNLWKPNIVQQVKELPILPNGKTDYQLITQTLAALAAAQHKEDDNDDSDSPND